MAIELQSIQKSFGTPPTQILRGISLKIEEGEWISITGKSGSGKSTLLYIMSTLDPATKGTLIIDGEQPLQMPEVELDLFRNRKMGFVFQFHYLIPEISIIDNILLPFRIDGSVEKHEQKAIHWLEQFELKSKINHFPHQLSGGEQQRIAIARALIRNPKYLFADEPTGDLDSQNGEAVMEIFKDINRRLGTTIVMVTHDRDFAAIASKTITLKDGALCSS